MSGMPLYTSVSLKNVIALTDQLLEIAAGAGASMRGAWFKSL